MVIKNHYTYSHLLSTRVLWSKYSSTVARALLLASSSTWLSLKLLINTCTIQDYDIVVQASLGDQGLSNAPLSVTFAPVDEKLQGKQPKPSPPSQPSEPSPDFRTLYG
jgi:hypothetical protein